MVFLNNSYFSDLVLMWILYNTQTQRDIKYEILARHIFFQIKVLIAKENLYAITTVIA